MIVGYASGVFDLLHVGHLNVLRRASLRCDRLIAGVTSDDEVARIKGSRPLMSCQDRMDLVGALRYVDEVYEDRDALDKVGAWNDLRFDVIFKGSDWAGTPKGDQLEKAFAELGVDVVYFPYTELTSSTMLRQAVNQVRERGKAHLHRTSGQRAS